MFLSQANALAFLFFYNEIAYYLNDAMRCRFWMPLQSLSWAYHICDSCSPLIWVVLNVQDSNTSLEAETFFLCFSYQAIKSAFLCHTTLLLYIWDLPGIYICARVRAVVCCMCVAVCKII